MERRAYGGATLRFASTSGGASTGLPRARVRPAQWRILEDDHSADQGKTPVIASWRTDSAGDGREASMTGGSRVVHVQTSCWSLGVTGCIWALGI